MERLGHLITEMVKKGKWRPVKASRSGPKISHLFFADDLVLFVEASIDQAVVLKNILQEFCEMSGQKVNLEKSKLFCSPNTPNDLTQTISDNMGVSRTQNLGKYLGMPLIHSKVTSRTYPEFVEKVNKRLAGWKSKCLSFAGRTTLIKSVISAIPSYAMQSTLRCN